MSYEELLEATSQEELIVKEKPLLNNDGRLKRKRLAIRQDIPTTSKKADVLAEASTENETTAEAVPSTETETTSAPAEDEPFASKLCESGLVSQEVAKITYSILKNDMGFEKISFTGANKY